jgi:hypothetical protein
MLSVIFTSAIQYIAETPAGMAAQKDFVQRYMSTLPDRWDDVKFIERKADFSKPIQLILQPYGGFVIKTVSP